MGPWLGSVFGPHNRVLVDVGQKPLVFRMRGSLAEGPSIWIEANLIGREKGAFAEGLRNETAQDPHLHLVDVVG